MKNKPPETRPYAPSFLDRFMDFIARLPLPYWLTYLLLFVLENLLVHALGWIFGWLPAFTFVPILFSFPLWLWGPMALMTRLNRVAQQALADFCPLLEVDDQQLERLKREFTVMPARSVLLSAVIWSIIYIGLIIPAFRSSFADYGIGPSFSGLATLEGLISFAIGSALYYHSFRQLRLVNWTVKMVGQFNLFRLNPVYAFSRVTSQIGVAWMVMLSLTLLIFPIKLASAPLLAILAAQALLAVAAFVLPLLFVNRRLVFEKRRLLAEHNLRLEATLKRLHQSIDEQKMDEVGTLNSAVNSLNIERTILTGIPTWPWRANTLTTFLSTLGLPIIIFLIQLLIKKLLGI